jgi:hypothetical protein
MSLYELLLFLQMSAAIVWIGAGTVAFFTSRARSAAAGEPATAAAGQGLEPR